ncbi:MAG: OmpH family outer membrane protein [Phycisphaerales bacterium]|nr:OmpH family outer membrane protein [Phycisphaerales bacterium]
MRIATSIVAASVLSSALTALFITGLDRPAAARAMPLLQDLGPADALILAGKDALRVINTDGRLSWSDQPGSRAFSLGTVHVGRILNALLKSAKYSDELEELSAARKNKGDEFEKRYRELMEKGQGINKDSPESPAMREQFEAFQKEYTAWSAANEVTGREMMARHYQGAYSDICEAVEVVADRRKIDLVMRFVPPRDKITPGDDADVVRQLSARTFLRVPESIDLTEDIISEMHLQAPKKD